MAEEETKPKKIYMINRIIYWAVLIFGLLVLIYGLSDYFYKLAASNSGF